MRLMTTVNTPLKAAKDLLKLGAETGFIHRRDPDVGRALNAAFVQTARIPTERGRDGLFDGPPDLAVKIISPNGRTIDVEAEITDFLPAGCLSVWIISPARRTITIHRPGRGPLRSRHAN